MRFSAKDLSSYDFRIIKKFAVFPIKLNYVSRFMQTVYIKQRRHKNGRHDWESLNFVSKDEYLRYRRLSR